MSSYVRKTLTIVKQPNGGFTVSTHTHLQVGERASTDSETSKYTNVTDVLTFAEEYLK